MSSRSKALCVAAVVAAAVAIWSWRRPPPPMPESMAPAASPTAALDPARRAAAIALAREPDVDPWAYAAKVAASSASAPQATCGLEQAPSPAQDDGAAAKPAGPGYVAAMHRVVQALRASLDPYDNAVADWLNAEDPLTPSDRRDALVARAVTTTDPRVYALAYGACALSNSQREGCKRPWISPDAGVNAAFAAQCAGGLAEQDKCGLLGARQWASLDADNAAPWLYLFDQATLANDLPGQQEALAHIASSSRLDERPFAAAGVVARTLPDDDDALAAKSDLVMAAIVLGVGAKAPLGTLTLACRDNAGGDADRARQCVAAADVLYERSDSLMAHVIGGVVYKQATGDASKLETARAERLVFSAHWSPATGFSPCQGARDLMKNALRNAQVGELEAARERSRTFVTP